MSSATRPSVAVPLVISPETIPLLMGLIKVKLPVVMVPLVIVTLTICPAAAVKVTTACW